MSDTTSSAYPSISAETRVEWREDAHRRGGVPHPTDPDPHTRYLSNRIVHLLDALDRAETMHAEAFRIAMVKQEQAARLETLLEKTERDARAGQCLSRLGTPEIREVLRAPSAQHAEEMA